MCLDATVPHRCKSATQFSFLISATMLTNSFHTDTGITTDRLAILDNFSLL